jgi:fibronectin type 3 domain-containing protein
LDRGFLACVIIALVSLASFANVGPGDRASEGLGAPDVPASPEMSSAPADATELMSHMSGFFTENLGQLANPDIRFSIDGPRLSAGFEDDRVVMVVKGPPTAATEGPGAFTTYSLSLVLVDCNDVSPYGDSYLPHATNYLIDADPARCIRGARSYSEVWYDDVWDGIDLRFYIMDGRLKYDLVLSSCARPGDIHMAYEGASSVDVDAATGDLVVGTPLGELRDARPIVQQSGLPGGAAPAAFAMGGASAFGFSLPPCLVAGSPMTIDPGLEFSTYFGGNNLDHPLAVAIDDDGNVLIAGHTTSTDYPLTTGAFYKTVSEGFVAKFDPDCSALLYCSYIPGIGNEQVIGLDLMPDGSIVIVGVTASSSMPTTANAFQRLLNGPSDAFVLVLDSTGSTIVYCSYFGGSANDSCRLVSAMADGRLVICGQTQSSDLPATAGAFCTTAAGNGDVFVARFGNDLGDLELCTYIGGRNGDGPIGLCIGGDLDVFVAGETSSPDFPTSEGAFCRTRIGGIFVLKLSEDWSGLDVGTYLGGTGSDECKGLAVAANGTMYVGGLTSSTDFPTTPDALHSSAMGLGDGFIAALSPDGTKLEYGTYVGGTAHEEPYCVLYDPGTSFVGLAGSTESLDLDTSFGCYNDEFTGGYNDVFVTGFNTTTMMMSYGTYIGGTGDLTFDVVRNGMMDDAGGIVLVGHTSSADFPTTAGAYSRSFAGGTGDAFILRLVPAPCGPTSAPTGLTATSGEGYIELVWDPPAGTGGYVHRHRVYRGDAPDIVSPIADVHNANGYIDTDVVNGKYYYYRVMAIGTAGESPMSDYVRARPMGTPSEPLGLKGTSGDGAVNLSWDPPAYDGGGDVQGYRIERGPFSDELAPYTDVGNVTGYIDAAVTLGEFYFYRVHAYNEKGEGNLSAVVRVKALDVPLPPRDFAAEPGDASVRLTWALPSRIGGSMLLGFKIYRGATPETMTLLATLGPMSLEHTDTGLVNGQDYIYYVTAYSEVGESQMSLVLDAIPFTLPGAPFGLVARAGDRWVELVWEPPESDGGRPVTHYNVFSSDGPGDLQLLVSIGAVTTFNNTGLTNGVTYYYQVQAITDGGESPRSEVASERPMGLPGPPTDLAGASASGGIRLTWRTPSNLGGADSLTYTVLRGSTADGLAVIATGVEALEYFDASIEVGSTYFYSVRAASSVGEGPPAGTVSVMAVSVPGGVMDLQAIAFDGRVHLMWLPPGQDGGSPVTGYVVLRGLLETGMAEVARVGAVTNYTDTTVTNGKRYLYAVQAVNAVGTGPQGELVEATPIGAPGAVGLLAAKVKGTSVVLTWAAPAAAGRAPVTGYTVMRGESAGALAPFAYLGPVLTYTDPTVERGKTYYYAVVAKSDVGDGQMAQSIPAKVQKTEDGPGMAAVTAVGALVALAAVATARRRR